MVNPGDPKPYTHSPVTSQCVRAAWPFFKCAGQAYSPGCRQVIIRLTPEMALLKGNLTVSRSVYRGQNKHAMKKRGSSQFSKTNNAFGN